MVNAEHAKNPVAQSLNSGALFIASLIIYHVFTQYRITHPTLLTGI